MTESADQHSEVQEHKLAGDPASSPQAVLPYETFDARKGVTVNRREDGLYVIVPRLRGWKMFLTWQWGIFAIVSFRIACAYSEHYFPTFDVAIFLILLSYNIYSIWRKRAFLVNKEEFRIGMVFGTRFFWTHEWPRSAVGEVKLNAHDGKMIIRIPGKDMKELRISTNKVVTNFVAETIQKGLRDEALD